MPRDGEETQEKPEPVKILTLDADDVASACPMTECIDEMSRVFALQADGKVESPTRARLSAPAGDILVMPSIVKRAKTEASMKVVSIFPNNKGMPSINAVVLLVDGENGEPKAAISGGALTSIRTGAVTGLSCRYLARKDSDTLGMVGAGGQAYQQVSGVLAELRRIRRVKIFSLQADRNEALARQISKSFPKVEAKAVATVDECVEGSDVVVTATTSKTPVFAGSKIREGTHVVAMGAYAPQTRELDSSLVARASIFVDSREAALSEAGDLLIPMREGAIRRNAIKAELSELVTGKKKGRISDSEVTVFKCVGLASEDNGAGWLCYRNAMKLGLGKTMEL
jgi:ornithine cyclodeaminase/alanine dehydrogenase-like protein (mu-crystallin family)